MPRGKTQQHESRVVPPLRQSLLQLDHQIASLNEVRAGIVRAIEFFESTPTNVITPPESPRKSGGGNKKGKRVYRMPQPVADDSRPMLDKSGKPRGRSINMRSMSKEKTKPVETRYTVGKRELIAVLAKGPSVGMKIEDIAVALAKGSQGVKFTVSAIKTCLEKYTDDFNEVEPGLWTLASKEED